MKLDKTDLTAGEIILLQELVNHNGDTKATMEYMNIAQGTFRKHLYCVNQKLKTNNQSGALLVALRRGLIEL